jgi:phosphoribosylcarboxyaminoimidazole (NCAIR) mutase
LAASIIALEKPEIRERLKVFRSEQTNAVLATPDPAKTE